MRPLYPADLTVDRRPHLQQLLHTLLHNHFDMLGALLEAPPIPTQADPEPTPAWLRLTQWTETVGVNMIMAVNDLRSLQVRGFGWGGEERLEKTDTRKGRRCV